jgi:hypothetical protein
VVDPARPDGAWLLGEVADPACAPYVVPDVMARGRLRSITILGVESWPRARLVRSPFGVRPGTILDSSPLPDPRPLSSTGRPAD